MDFELVPLRVPHQGQTSVSVEQFIRDAAILPIISIDTETNGQDVRDGRGYCQGISMAYDHPTLGRLVHYMPFRHKVGANLPKGILWLLRDMLLFRKEHKLPYVFHNSKFDIVSLDTIGIDVYGAFHYCTMRMSHLLNENIYSQKLDALTKRFLNNGGKRESPEFQAFVKAVGWENVPSELMYEYGAGDADITLDLFLYLKPKWDAEKIDNVWEDKLHGIEVFQSMEKHGVKIDVPFCQHMAAIAESALADIVEILDINPGSPKGLQKLLIDELGLPVLKRSEKTGKPSFDKEVMKEYDLILEHQESDTAQLVLAYRGWQKSNSSNYIPYVRLLSPDGKLRPNYKLHSTKTLRASCEDPNLQQIPKVSEKPWNGRMKKAFIPDDEEWELWEADYSQLEFRITAAVTGEPHLLEVFADDSRDIFDEMKDVLGLTRQATKTFVYATGYGAGVNKIAYTLGVPHERAREVRQDYWDSYPLIRKRSEEARITALKRGKIRLWSGRYRHFFDPQKEAHKAFNSWVQGGAADIVERVMWRLYKEVESADAHMLLQVHDSVVWAIRKKYSSKILPEIKRIMEDVQPDFGVRFRVDIHRWGE